MNIEQFLDILKEYINIIWQNDYTKGIFFYLIYIIVYLILSPIFKLIIDAITKKTNTNLDDRLYNVNRFYIKFLVGLFGFVVIYRLYFMQLSNTYVELVYVIVVTGIYIVFYFIFHESTKIVLHFITQKYASVITKNMANLLKIILDVVIISIIVILILNIWGVNVTPLLASAGIFGIAIAMASKNIIENFLSGLIIFADKNININDTVILNDDTSCVVQEINVRTTILKTFDGDIVILPNSEFLNQKVINKSLSQISEKKRVSVEIGISYGDDTEKAKELLLGYVRELEGIDEESVVAFVSELGDRSVNVKVRAMIDSSKRSYLLQYQVLEKAYKEFPKNGLNFPFPTYTIEQDLKNNSGK